LPPAIIGETVRPTSAATTIALFISNLTLRVRLPLTTLYARRPSM
jgi:hypothetical protein